jgi:hypothetical protein
MGVHLYCVVLAGSAPAPGLAGVEGATVTCLAAGPLSCWVSRHERPPEPDRDALRAHNAVAVAAMDSSDTPVPMRFGQWFDAADAAVEKVLEHETRWSMLLARFAGRAEYGVVVSTAEPLVAARDVRPPRPTTGKAYMAELARKAADTARLREATESATQWLARHVGALAADTRADTAADGLVRVAHLVAWTDASAYRSALRAAHAERPDLRLATTGPWPPYSFVGESS